MIVEQIYLECLSQASYVVADEQTRRAVVVDPRRDISAYLEFARERDLSIELVVLTHVHADFVPGHTELAEATGATIAMSAAAPVSFPFRGLADGERISLGDPDDGAVLEVLATPGHTPESITLALYEHGRDEHPAALLTGDTLFIGDVGRPDLLGSFGRKPEDMARELYRSLHERVLTLPDEVLVYPGHGAGSACGKALSTATVSSLGEQRRTNYALADMDVETFVGAVIEGQGEPPRYFLHDVALNRAGHPAFDPDQPVRELAADAAIAFAAAGGLLLDVRDDQAFAAGHLRGSVNAGLSGRFAEYAAAVHADGQRIAVVGSAAEAAEARLRLARVGVDDVEAWVDARVLAEEPGLVEQASRVTAAQARDALARGVDVQVVDVRNPAELIEGEVPGARNLPLPNLLENLIGLDPARPVLVVCAGGYRSSAAASLLRARGFTDVSDLLGGYTAWGETATADAALSPG